MTNINEDLTNIEHEKMGLDLVSRLKEDTRFKFDHHGGGWAFSNKDANLAEDYLVEAKTKSAWNGLGNLYEKTADLALKIGGTEVGGVEGKDYLAYWAIRSYLIAGNEEKAIEVLKKFSKTENVMYTLCGQIKDNKDGQDKKLIEGPSREFSLPEIKKYKRFNDLVHAVGIKYLN